MHDMPRIYPDFLSFGGRHTRGRQPTWMGYEWAIHLVVDCSGRIQSGSVVAWKENDTELGPLGVVDLEFGPFDDLRLVLNKALVDSAIKGSQLPLW